MYVSDERGVHAGQIALFAVLSKFHTGLFCRSSILFRARSTADSVVEEADSYSRARSQPCDSADACARFETTLAEPTAVANLACCSNMITCDSRKENRHSFVLMPVLMSACAIPISMLFWTVNVAYSILWPAHSTEGFVYDRSDAFAQGVALGVRSQTVRIYMCTRDITRTIRCILLLDPYILRGKFGYD